MKFIERVSRALALTERSLIIIMLSVMTLLSFLQVVLRNLFSFGFLWADPMMRYMVMWVGFLGAVHATREGKHFGIDFLNRFLSPRNIHIVKIIVDSFAATVAFLLMRAAWQFLIEGIGADETDIFDLPKRFYFAIIPIGFGLIGLQFTFNVIRHTYILIIKRTAMVESNISHNLP